MPGILFGRLFDMGYLRLPMLFASALLVVATIVTGQCTEYLQFLLCQGVATGVRDLYCVTSPYADPHYVTDRKRDSLHCYRRHIRALVR